jgi:hypothetical protein
MQHKHVSLARRMILAQLVLCMVVLNLRFFQFLQGVQNTAQFPHLLYQDPDIFVGRGGYLLIS